MKRYLFWWNLYLEASRALRALNRDLLPSVISSLFRCWGRAAKWSEKMMDYGRLPVPKLLVFITNFTFPMLIRCARETCLRTSRTKMRCPIRKFLSVFSTFKLEVDKWKLLFSANYVWRKPVPQRTVRQIYCSISPHFSNLKTLNRNIEQ